MELPEDKMLTPGQLLLIQEALEKIKTIVLEKREKIMEDNINQMAAGGGMTPSRKAAFNQQRAKDVQEILEIKDLISPFSQAVEDTMSVLHASLFERAKLVHQAMREASKTDPSLLDAVRELDDLYAEALREQQELNEEEQTKPEED